MVSGADICVLASVLSRSLKHQDGINKRDSLRCRIGAHQ